MRISYTALISRLALLTIYPAVAFAAEPQGVSTLHQVEENLTKIQQAQSDRMVGMIDTQTMSFNRNVLIDNNIELPSNSIIPEPQKEVKAYRFDEEELVARVQKVKALITGYSSTVSQTDSTPFITASGSRVKQGTMACPPQYPFGTKLKIEGMGTFICEDRGGKIKGNHFDMWFPSTSQAIRWGKRTVDMQIIR